jgi:serine/threonine-protein kinase
MDPLEKTQLDPAQAGKPRPSDPTREPTRIGSYRLLRRLGEGGMGSVFLGYDEQNSRPVAVKILSEQLARNQAYVDRFYREARSGTLLNHPSIVRSYGAGQDEESRRHFLVLEYVDGTSAQALLDKYGRLSVGDAVHIALDVARGLEHAHSRNIIHRDVKPDNILITRAGVSKLSDLGLSKRIDEASHLTAARQGFGTPYYMPYEQAINARHADGRSDLYALGATLYHLLTGEVPFPGESHLDVVEKKERGEFIPASVLNASVPKALDAIIAKLLARHPRDRYQTASELIVDLERSRLAAPILSYADPDLALQDPWVRACLASSAQPTRPDMGQPVEIPGIDEVPRPEPMWIVRFQGKDGRWRRGKLSTAQLAERLRTRRVPITAQACPDPGAQFRPLGEIAEFRAIVASIRQQTAPPARPPRKVQPHPPPVQAAETPIPPSHSWALLGAGLATVLLIGLVVAFVLVVGGT